MRVWRGGTASRPIHYNCRLRARTFAPGKIQSIAVVILALDTTTKTGSCALWRDGAIVDERPGRSDRTHAERLPGELADLLGAHGLHPADVDRYAVASGPGSFTGLRVGIATIQALALVHDRLVVPVSALEALAQCGARLLGDRPADSGEAALVGAWMEAYRGEVFGALYRVRDAVMRADSLATIEEVVPPEVTAPAILAADWATKIDRAPRVIIGDGVAPSDAALRAQWPDARLEEAVPLAGVIARIAAASPDRAVRPHAIVPLYVRRPDAELARARQQQV